MKYSFYLLALLLLLGCETTPNGEPIPETTYFPSDPGRVWTYKTRQSDGSETSSTKRVLSRDWDAEKRLFKVVIESTGGGENYTDYYSIQDGAVFLDSVDFDSFDDAEIEPRMELNAILKPGTSWKYEDSSKAFVVRMDFVVIGPETVSVPAGQFQTLRIKSAKSFGEFTLEESLWYAPDVGLVKQMADGPGVNSSTELTSFTDSTSE